MPATLSRYFRTLLILVLGLLLTCGCGGGSGGGGGDDGSADGNVGAGWVTIDYSTAAGGSTTSDSVYLDGQAFVSPTWFACCSGTPEVISGVIVNWENVTTGASGKASQRVVIHYVLFTWIDHYWSASIPLVDGDNLIRVTATDPAGNIGRISTTVTRIPAAPTVTATFPADGAEKLPVDTPITATFNEAMVPASINATSFLLRDAASSPVAGQVTYSDKTATFKPFARLDAATRYTATLTTAVRDESGTAMTADRSWSFTTGSDYWQATATLFAPTGRSGHSAVWSGTEMIIWGGSTGGSLTNTGGRYNPATDQWSAISTVNAPSPRADHLAVWTGSRMIVWGGYTGDESTVSGASYDPVTNAWQPISTLNAPSVRSNATAVWTGSRMIIWGGYGSTILNTGASYDPATDSWRPLATDLAPFRTNHSAVWTGTEMIVWGGLDADLTWPDTGAVYNPATDRWGGISQNNAPVGRGGHSAVWTGTEMVIWGGRGGTAGNPVLNSGGRYDPVTALWRPTATTGAPLLSDSSTVWTGAEMIVWGPSSLTLLNSGARYNPVANSWGSVSILAAPAPRSNHTGVWTDTEMIIWGGDSLDTGGSYVP